MSVASTPMNLNLTQVAAWLPGAQRVGDAGVCVQRVHTDTRSLQAGDLFVALRGERFDAHDFLTQAAAAGAVAALAERGLTEAGLSGVQVDDTRQALGELAHAWRAQFSLPLVAVTGSNGKTTVTQMIASILHAWAGDASLATQGNLNNDIGVPLTLLRLRQNHRCAVVELGMNHPGEIAGLARMAAPSVALVNNAQREHQEFMVSVRAVAEENGSVIAALSAQGVAVFPSDDDHTAVWQALAGARRCLRFGDGGEVHSVSQQWQGDHWQVRIHTPQGEVQAALHIAGLHNVRNALAATACALAAGVPTAVIAQGLSQFEPVKGRSRARALHLHCHDFTLVDDSYNANPDSVLAAVDVLTQLPGPRLLVLGDMGEVGTQGPDFHAEVGRYAQQCGIEQVFTLGALTRHTAHACAQARHFEEVDALIQAVHAQLPQVGSVLVKGSRFMKMERVVQAIEAQAHDAMHKESTCC